MKATLDIADPLFRKAKARAAERGQSLKDFVTEALLALVGIWTTGPVSQIHVPGLAGDRNAVKSVSPMPSLLSMSGPTEGGWITGTMVRAMTFQSLLAEVGITGWMLRVFCVSFSGPDVQTGVVLQRQAGQVADRVLREPGENHDDRVVRSR